MLGDHKFIKMRDSAEIHSKIWENGSTIWVIATHGISEHLERHEYLREIVGSEYNLFQYDLRGHGRSMGKRAYIKNFSQYLDDLQDIILYLQDKFKMKKYILFGHSMGGLITAGFLQSIHAKDVLYPSAVLLNAPLVGVGGPLGLGVNTIPKKVFSVLKNIKLSISLSGLVDVALLSHDPRVAEQFNRDELNNKKIHTKLLLEMVCFSKMVFSRPLRPHCPLYCSIGDGDLVVSVDSFLHYFSIIEKAAKVKVFKGALHEAHNEIDKYKKPYFEHMQSLFRELRYID